MIYKFIFKIYSQKNDLDTVKVIFCDIIGCSIRVYNFMLLKSSIKIFYIHNIPNLREL